MRLIIYFSVLLMLLGCQPDDMPQYKPNNPLIIQVIEQEKAPSELNDTLEIQVTSHVAISNLVVEVTLPQRAVITSGNTHWQGAIAAGESLSLIFTAQFDLTLDNPIIITAFAQDVALATRAQITYHLGDQSRMLQQGEKETYQLGREVISEGRRLREISLDHE